MKEKDNGERRVMSELTPGEIDKIMETVKTSMPVSYYKKIYKRHRYSGLFKKWNSASEFDENVSYNTMELIHLAELPHTPLSVLLKLGKHRNPEVRLAATTHHSYPQKLKHPIYDDIIANNGYGDSYILLDALSRV